MVENLLSKIKFNKNLSGKIELIPHLSLESIVPSETLVRELDGATINDLRESIREKGLLQPILVRPIKKGKYEIIFGNHRYYACKGLEWKTIPAQIKHCNKNEALLLGLIENIQRVEMNPVREGELYSKLLSTYNYKSLSKKIGKGVTYLKGRVKIYENLHPNLKKELGKKLTIINALQLSKIPLNKQLEVFETIEKTKKELEQKFTPKQFHGGGFYDVGWLNTCQCPRCGGIHRKGVNHVDLEKP